MDELGNTLLRLARNAIGEKFGLTPKPAVDLPTLHENAATFVTLTQQGALRGCIGSLEAWRPLLEDVQANARNAAFHDPRFMPLSACEFSYTHVEVSLLTPAEAMQFKDEADALSQFRPLIDGVILSKGGKRATFLPQVWEQLPEPEVFLAHLKEKAGLPANYWGQDLCLLRYTVKKWKDG
ncbi:AmmeMemoRadiSam system protein A [Azonexus sp.]|uniref:AmmeMemoRadiSam system protein A n=1 Tax=Azonexus sp. TaxID=1872668 RepID=UPI0027B94112|nr:AmmeMemoRadiSam system protein A [Azonexus sp.]